MTETLKQRRMTGTDKNGVNMHEISPTRPMARLASLPPSMSDAFEAMKLAILRERLSGWKDVSLIDVLDALENLKAFVEVRA